MASDPTASPEQGTMAQKLASVQIPPPVEIQIDRAVDELRQAGIGEQRKKVGEQAPDFALPGVDGETVQLSTLLENGPVVLVFYRGIWCPYCNVALNGYQAVLPEIEASGATLVAVSPQTPDHSLSMVEKHALRFPVLSDNGNVVADAYGLVFPYPTYLQETYKEFGLDISPFNGDHSWRVPIPGSFIIDESGIIRLAFVDIDFRHRLEPQAILDALKALEVKKW